MANSKDISRIGAARGEFAAARQDFDHITARLDFVGPLYGVAEAVPWLGAQARAAKKLMRAGGYVSRAGEEACLAAEALVEAGTKSSGGRNTELIISAVPAAIPHLSVAMESLDRARDEYAGLSSEGLHPLLARALNELDTQVPRQRAVVQSGLDALRALPEILGVGGEKVYLLLVQDADELRPTGGFIGNYGIIRLRDGKMVESLFNDAYRVDWPYYYAGRAPRLPGMFQRYLPEATFWALRDSNVWPDFERSAKQAAWFAVDEGATDRVDGVIAITDDIVQPLMKVVGPITIEDFEETVDQSNVLKRIRFHQSTWPSDELRRKLGEKVEKNRKYFTSLVLGAITERLNNLDMAGMINLAMSLQDSFKTKGVQLYFPQPELQRLVEAYDLGGQMKASPGDYLWVVDMNLSASKDNVFVKPSISYSVSISATDGAISELELTYDYSQEQGDRYTGVVNRTFYGDYVRVYVPAGSKLLSADGTDEPVETLSELGKTVFGNFIKMYPGTVRKVKLRYWQPLKLWTSNGEAKYELVVQKQAGNHVQNFETTVLLPEGSTVHALGGFESSGANTLGYRGPLISDMRFEASFTLR